jgi:hypothetical protein
MNNLNRIVWVLIAVALAPTYTSAQSFAYLADDVHLSAYSINPATGALSPVPGSPSPQEVFRIV